MPSLSETIQSPPPAKDDLMKKFINIEIDHDNHIVRNVTPMVRKATDEFQTIAEFIAHTMERLSKTETIGLIDAESDKKELSYKDWYRQSKRFASSLINEHQLNRDDIVVFYSENSIDYAVTMIGAIFTGCTIIPIKTANGKYELVKYLNDSRGTILIIDCKQKLSTLESVLMNEQYRKDILEHLRLIILLNKPGEDDDQLANIKSILKDTKCKIDSYQRMINTVDNGDGDGDDIIDKIPYFPITKDDHFIIIFTSGTTGTSKGTIHSNYSFLSSMRLPKLSNDNDNDNPNELQQQHRIVWYPLSHISGSFILISNIVDGRTNVLFANNQLERLLRFVSEHRLSALSLSPKHVIEMAQNNFQEKFDLSSMKLAWTGGAKIPGDIVEIVQKKYGILIVEGYGSTEYLASMTNLGFMFGRMPKPGSVGNPAPGVEMKIIDMKTGEALPAEKQGELLFRGSQGFVGYLRNEEATRAAIDSDGWYHTGDIGYYDNEGYLYIVDRIKEIVKFRYWNLIPSEIESFIMENYSSAIDNVCVVGVPHIVDGYHLRAYVQLLDGNGKTLTEKEIIDSVRENMGFHKRLRAGVRFVDHVPRTSIDKVDRKYFRSL
ncbi:hypothetical protein BLA29_002374, partial [Euroglyphus maynei]